MQKRKTRHWQNNADFGPIFARLYPKLFGELAREGVAPTGPTYGLYEQHDDGGIVVMAGVEISPTDAFSTGDVSIVDLQAAERAATLVHDGSMATIGDSFAIIQRWLEATDDVPAGLGREVYLDCEGDQSTWVTEIQFALS